MTTRVIVTVADLALPKVRQLARDLRQAGMVVDQVLTATGIITGSVDPASLAKLRALPGVDKVEPDSDFQLPPPDSEVQ
jgi:hypothetical protein